MNDLGIKFTGFGEQPKPKVAPTQTQATIFPENSQVSAVKEIKPILPTATTVGAGYKEVETKVLDVVTKLKAITKIETDEDLSKTREIAVTGNKLVKEIESKKQDLNKPYKEAQQLNNDYAKKLVTELELLVNSTRGIINNYEQDKEKKRQEELKKIEEQKRKEEAAKAAELQRVKNIRDNITKVRQDGDLFINNAKTSKDLTEYLDKMNKWIPTKEFYGEFHDEIMDVRNNIITHIDLKMSVVKEQEDLKKKKKKMDEDEAALKQKEIDAKKKQMLDDAAMKKREEEALKAEAENTAYRNLIIEFTKHNIKDAISEINKQAMSYGSFSEVHKNIDKVTASYQQQVETEKKIKEVSSVKPKNLREVVKFEIVDANAIPKEFLSPDEAKIREKVELYSSVLKKDITAFQIDGVRIWIDQTSVLR